MRVLTYEDGRDILRPESEGGHVSVTAIPENAKQRAKVAYRISDNSVLVLALSSWGEGRLHYYEWYTQRELA